MTEYAKVEVSMAFNALLERSYPMALAKSSIDASGYLDGSSGWICTDRYEHGRWLLSAFDI